MADKKVALMITSAIAIQGKIIVPGQPEAENVIVDEALAKNLIGRGRAELWTEEMAKAAAGANATDDADAKAKADADAKAKADADTKAKADADAKAKADADAKAKAKAKT